MIRMRTLGLSVASCCAAEALAGNPTTTTSFSEVPGAVFVNLVSPSSSAPVGPFHVAVGGQIVVVTSSSSLTGASPYYLGWFDFFGWTFKHPNDPAIDPGEWDGFYGSYSPGVSGHLVLDFDVPLSAFGMTTMQEWANGNGSEADTLFAYDGPGGTGNLIGSITTKPRPEPRFWVELDFVAVLAGDGPPIRSVVLDGGPVGAGVRVYLDGIALSVGSDDACAADLSGSSDPNDAAYGVPDGIADSSDFFYFLDQFSADNLAVADLTGSADPNDPSYGTPDGVVDAADFFYFLDVFVAGC